MDELMFHLAAPLDGTNEGMIREYLSMCVAPAVLVLIVTVILFLAWHNKRRYFVLMGGGVLVSLVLSTKVIYGAWNELDAGGYVESQGTYSTFIDDNYVDPTEVALQFPEKKRNLIYIFLESMEITYADEKNGGGFKKNVIPELTRIAQENEDFSGEDTKLNGGYCMPGATWTMGAMFGQTSGLPLSINIDQNSMDTQDSFFSGVIALGDILENAGYSQTLMIGSDATFGGRRLYFTEHGDYDIVDYNYAIDTSMIPENYKVWWGYEDQKLLEFAKKRLVEVDESGEPFCLMLLTADTHFEDGYVCECCWDFYRKNQYANVMACSSRQVSEFVSWIQQQSFYENTTIVLVGDHLTMDSDFCEDVDSDYVRKVYTSYINSSVEVEVNKERNFTTFDFFPTTLAALGVEIEGERLGLGTTLFSTKQTLTERFGIESVRNEIERRSKLLEKLADLDEDKPELLIRQGKIPKANIEVEEYKSESGILPVRVTNFENISNGVADVIIAVWTEEDQSDIQWLKLEIQEDSSYYIGINTSIFNYKLGEYHIHAYVVDGAGEQYMVAETIGVTG
ncbi:sulfatase-like hydrolase/transferase [Sporofaciens musculi]|uniref:sulfatase-like hydrolase/transferase n=1 Tax=Sporofaciens musculi TaxID=2681861 RepID=UPI0025A014CC|nr:sulfatase-like hydrolase/transferase [Sporofaciens musculi]